MKKTILLTWGTWFLWSHIIEDLSAKYTIIALKRSFSDVSKIQKYMQKVIFFDIDSADVETIFRDKKIDCIIHTATTYGRSSESLASIIETNLLFPMRLLELGIQYGVWAFLNSDTFWDETMELPIGLKYYALSKKDFLKYAHLAIKEHTTMKFVNLKIEHLYGPRDNEKKFLPYIISTLLGGKERIPLTLWEQKRDFVYVKDVVSAYDIILDNIEWLKDYTTEYDLGTGEVYSIRQIVEKIQSMLWTSAVLDFGSLEYRKWEVMEVKADISTLSALWWKSVYSIEKWLAETISSMKTL